MKDYKDMNIFDRAALLQDMISDNGLCFMVSINGKSYAITKVEVTSGVITLSTNEKHQELIKKLG